MARYRNPRFAPEFLERKLSPSAMMPTAPAAQVAPFDDPEPLPPPDIPDYPFPLPTTSPTLPVLPG